MRLTKLELHGFKSFADATDLVFEAGVTAIVGPNGCGKSNVSDAVRWVLGEQRARLLRGAKMEEVIFQGSSSRRAVNIAEVSLHFENEDGSLPIPFQEVVITRRLARSGESEYLLNNAPCRLRDIHDLLRGTGLAADAGVVIESRMVDALLSDRPDDRRELFEEAAGVGLYRDRRRSTERRLDETTADLLRLDDLLSEVQSQVRSLARQRKRAERHTELTARRFIVEMSLAAREMAAWREELVRLEEHVAALRQTLPATEERVTSAEVARDASHGERSAAEGRRAELARLVEQQRDQLRQLQSEVAVAEERQRNALARRERAEEERREGEQHGVRLSSDRERAAGDRRQLEVELHAAMEARRRCTEAESGARQELADARAALETAEQRVREARERAGRLDLDRERARREIEELEQRAAHLRNDQSLLLERVATLRRELGSAADALELAQANVERHGVARAAAHAADRNAREQDAAARTELFRTDEVVVALRGKVNALETLERERVGLAPAAARLLHERERFGDGAIIGPLSDFISAEQEPAALVERFLGPTVHAVLVRDAAAAAEVRRWHASAKPGPLLLLPLDRAPEPEETENRVPEELVSLVRALSPGRGWVRELLGRVTSVEAGTAFIDARGAVFLPGSGAGPGPLRRRAELYRARAELATAETARESASAHAEQTRAALEEAERLAAAAAEASASAQHEARRAQELADEMQRRWERAERELGEAAALGERLATRREELEAALRVLDEQSSRIAKELVRFEDSITAARARSTAAEAAQEEARELRTAAQVEEAQLQARLQVASDRERRLSDEIESASTRLETLRSELSELAQADGVLAERMARWHLDLETREATLRDGEGRLADSERAVESAEVTLTAAEQELDALRRRAHVLGEELHQAELRHAELSGRRAAIQQRLEIEWRRPLEEMLASVSPIDVEDAPLRAEAEELRQQLEALGPVNPLAIEEHAEELKRLDFLGGQRDDLAAAKQSLQQAIREIDVTARELFLATFAQVRENFRQIFMTLFGGGECDLRLENPEAPLDCDIEIHASPRGKRTQRIHLLSSGERALVALSLLFGIFLTKPSPFCLLDEVDAPLDDANIGRFVRMLNQFKSRTQFIVITHNPRTTTEAADAVYGVTMQEPGVSSLVSVRIPRGETAHAVADRAVAEHLAAVSDEPVGESAEALPSPA